jgi:hypothetical protein
MGNFHRPNFFTVAGRDRLAMIAVGVVPSGVEESVDIFCVSEMVRDVSTLVDMTQKYDPKT